MGGISGIGAAHVAMGSVALVSGAVVLMVPKGTARHRRVGRIYAATILAINATALSMYDLTGRFNVFHVIALVNLATLAMDCWRYAVGAGRVSLAISSPTSDGWR